MQVSTTHDCDRCKCTYPRVHSTVDCGTLARIHGPTILKARKDTMPGRNADCWNQNAREVKHWREPVKCFHVSVHRYRYRNLLIFASLALYVLICVLRCISSSCFSFVITALCSLSSFGALLFSMCSCCLAVLRLFLLCFFLFLAPLPVAHSVNHMRYDTHSWLTSEQSESKAPRTQNPFSTSFVPWCHFRNILGSQTSWALLRVVLALFRLDV